MAEDKVAETPKRKAGRPPKPESEKKQKVVAKASEAKRGRGRPKGSKNKPKKLVVTKGKRGRQAKKESASEESAEDAE
ncbi:high mobility group protein HMG-I/HMG-Y-like [Macrobrachium nipponense]|uniref:high mobility group protein HMG-I/HMG-Y-like n=1 Tax=Macrobrachium nipponense TaxID=159736 RepID=UPI0030C853E9